MGNNASRKINQLKNKGSVYDDALIEIEDFKEKLDSNRQKFIKSILITQKLSFLESIDEVKNSTDFKVGLGLIELNKLESLILIPKNINIVNFNGGNDENINEGNNEGNNEVNNTNVNNSASKEDNKTNTISNQDNKINTKKLESYIKNNKELVNDKKLLLDFIIKDLNEYFKTGNGIVISNIINDLFEIYKYVYSTKIDKRIKKRCVPIKPNDKLLENPIDKLRYFDNSNQTNTQKSLLNNIKMSNNLKTLIEDLKYNDISTIIYNITDKTECETNTDFKLREYSDLAKYGIMPDIYKTSLIQKERNYTFIDYDYYLNKENCKNKIDLSDDIKNILILNKLYQIKIIILTKIQQNILQKTYNKFKELFYYDKAGNKMEKYNPDTTLLDSYYNKNNGFIANIFKSSTEIEDKSLSDIVNLVYDINTNEKKQEYELYFQQNSIGIIQAEKLYNELINDKDFYSKKYQDIAIQKINDKCDNSVINTLSKQGVNKNDIGGITKSDITKSDIVQKTTTN